MAMVGGAALGGVGGALWYFHSAQNRAAAGTAPGNIYPELQAIRRYLIGLPASQRAALGSQVFNSTSGNWDIIELGAQTVGGANTGKIVYGGKKHATVTVAGKVYPQEEVNYYLYGAWYQASDRDPFMGEIAVMFHRTRPEWLGARPGEGLDPESAKGRVAWFLAGYYDELSWVAGHEISGMAPTITPYSGSLHFQFGAGSARVSKTVSPDGTIK